MNILYEKPETKFQRTAKSHTFKIQAAMSVPKF